MIVFFFRWHIPSIHPCKRDTALYRHRPGRRLEKDIFVQLRRIYLSDSQPTVPGARIRDFPAAPRLPEILRGRRPAPQIRPCRRGARRHPARRRPPHPHAGGPSRRRAVRAGRRSVRLNRRGRAYYEEVRRILLDIHETTERFRDATPRRRASARVLHAARDERPRSRAGNRGVTIASSSSAGPPRSSVSRVTPGYPVRISAAMLSEMRTADSFSQSDARCA